MAGLTLCASASANEAASTGRSTTSTGAAGVQTQEFGKPGAALEQPVAPGGGGEAEGNGGLRGNPAVCNQGSSNCYDRPAGTAPYNFNLSGQFNTQQFLTADNFIPSASDNVTSVCWRGWWAPDSTICTAPSNPPGTFHLNFFNDAGTGLPGSSITSAVEGVDLTVTQGLTGDPVGFNNPTQLEVIISGVLGTPLAVNSGTCYWVEIDWDAESSGGALDQCFFELGQSYELVEGDRRLVRRDESTGNPYQESDAVNRDIMLCVGFAGATTLVNANTAPCYPGSPGPDPRVAPTNNEITPLPPMVACGASILADNTYATTNVAWGDVSCRIIQTDPTNYTANDLFYRFQTGPGVTSAIVTTCNSALLGGQAPGDSLLQVFRQGTGIGINNPPLGPADVVQIGCSDNACAGGLSSVAVSGLTQNTIYYVRLVSANAGAAGKYTLTVDCPIPTPANDFCGSAISIPTAGSPSINDANGVNTVQVSTANASVDGQYSGCPGASNTAKSVWYKLVGQGNLVRLSTDQPVTGLTPYDTRLTVYCSGDGSCTVGQLACVDADDDIDATNNNFASEVTFCATAGRTYYILLHGFGTSTGAAIVNARTVRDINSVVIACCDAQVCTFTCDFEIPCGASDEANAIQDYFGVQGEPCNPANSAATNNNNGPNFGAAPFDYGRIYEGVAMRGYAWAVGQVRDNDWWIYQGIAGGDGGIGTFIPPSMMEFTSSHTGPHTYFVSQSRGANFATGSFGGLGQLSGALPTEVCGETRNTRYAFSHLNNSGNTVLATRRDGLTATAAGNVGEWAWRIRSGQTGEGYPCGVNTDYWVRVDWVLPTQTCNTVATPGGADDEVNAPAFSGVAGGEACEQDVMNGCDHTPTVTDDFFQRLQVGVPMTGRLFSDADAGASRDIEQFKISIPVRSVVRIAIDSSGPTSIFFLNDDCTADAFTYGVAATRGSCYPGIQKVDDQFIVEAGTYQVNVGSGDAFGSFNGIFVQIDGCTSPIMKWVAQVDATPVPGCSPVCPGATAEVETACEPFGTECTADNDGCAESVFQAGTLVSGTNVSGTLFSTFDPPPLGTGLFQADVDYWQFTVANNSRITFNIVSNGPVFGLIADTGVGGVNCLDIVNGVRVLGSIDATSCSGGSPVSRTCYLEPGTYSLILAPGSVLTGTNGADLGHDVDDCVGAISYCASATIVQVGRCCVGTDCTITSSAECTGTWDGAATCGNGYSVGALDAGCSAFSTISGGGGQLTNFLDEEVRQVAIPAFKFYGTTYTQLGVGSNGYVEFIPGGGASTGSGARARSFPNAALPNGIAAAYWRDWEPNAPGASVHIVTSGGVTTIEWNNVAVFNDWAKRASFQILLTHATGGIEYRYGTFTGLSCDDLTRLSVGAEGASGLNGANFAAGASFLTGGHCLKLTPTTVGNPCAAPVCCQGNADKVAPGAVNFADITAVLASFNANYGGGNTGPGDADCNGVVNFADITAVLANFNAVCP